MPAAELQSYENAKTMLPSVSDCTIAVTDLDTAAAKIAITGSVATISVMQALVKTGMFATSARSSDQAKIAASIIADYEYGNSAGDAVCATV